ncbi:GT2 family glycosyltransferase [Mycobacterium sp. URHB0021]|jgi:GT2 family glycosyltransferase
MDLLSKAARRAGMSRALFGAYSRWKSANLIGRLIALSIGLACALWPAPAADEGYEKSGFVRASRNESVRYQFASVDAHADVTAVIVTHNSASDISPLIDDLRVAAADLRLRVVVVDNQSSDGTADIVRTHRDVRLIESTENLGYAGGINAGQAFADPCDAVLILNPDLALAPDTVTRLLAAANTNPIGAVVPLMLRASGATFFSLRREPSLTRAIGDALLGGKARWRPGFLSQTDTRLKSYAQVHDVDWATGAAVLIPAATAREVGAWNEEFFLYSEEIDYFRRIRESGRVVRFEPLAVVEHRGQGSGASPALAVLMAVNRVRYVERHHGRAYSVLFRAVAALAEGLRFRDAVHRRTLTFILDRSRWDELPTG